MMVPLAALAEISTKLPHVISPLFNNWLTQCWLVIGRQLINAPRRGNSNGRAILFFVMLLPLPVWATTYYVDNCVSRGLDSNNGTTTSTPWLTIAHVNAQSFNPSDSVLFQRTCTWRETLIVPSSGSSGNVITFGAYGMGAEPIIDGANVLSSWATETSTQPKPNVLCTNYVSATSAVCNAPLPTLFYANAPAFPVQVFRDGARLTLAASKSTMVTGTWWWDSVNLRLYLDDNPGGHTIEASVRNNAVYINAHFYITIQNLDIEKALQSNVLVNGASSYFAATTITSNYSAWSGIDLEAPANASTPLQSAVIQNSTCAYNGEKGIMSEGNTNSLLIQGNVVHHDCLGIDPNYSCGTTPCPYCGGIDLFSDSDGAGGTPLARPLKVIAQYNQVYLNGISNRSQRGFGIWFDTLGAGSQIRYNTAYSNSMCGLDMEYPSDAGDTGKVQAVISNLSYNNTQCGVLLSRHSHDSVIANNTTYGNWTNIEILGDFSGHDSIGMDNNIVSDNISFGWTGYSFAAYWGAENDDISGFGNVYTHNALGGAASNFIRWGESSFISTYTAWETAKGNCGTTGCSHSVQSDPNNSSGGNFTCNPLHSPF